MKQSIVLLLFITNVYASPNLIPASFSDIGLTDNIILDFDIDVYNRSPDALIELRQDGGALIESFYAINAYLFRGSADGSGKIVGNQITLNPGADLQIGTSYYILIPVGSDIRDHATTVYRVTPVTSTTTYNFSTASVVTKNIPTLSFWGLLMLSAFVGLYGVKSRNKKVI